jgi:glycosyltransferase involved in cell wall biosynthesis
VKHEDSSGRIDIWYLITSLDVGGAERTLVDLVSELDRDRFAPTIWTITAPGALVDNVPDDVPVRSLDVTSKAEILAPIRFLRAVRAEQPEVIQSFLYFDNLLASVSKLSVPKTTVITGVRCVPNELPLHRDITSRLKIYCSDHIVSNSEAGRQHIIDKGANPEQVNVVRNGRDIEKYANGEATSELYEELGLSADAPIVGTVGRLIERKGHYDLIEAWPQVLEEFPDAQLLLVGDGPEREGLKQLAKQLGCVDSVVFAGERDDVPNLLDAMDIFVFPSHYEGLPGALIEAMIAGLPVIATPVDGNAELIDHKRTGLFVDPHSGDQIAVKIKYVLKEESIKKRLSRNASNISKSEFHTGNMVRSFEKLYE